MPNGRDSTLRCAPCAGTVAGLAIVAVLFVMGFAAVRTNTLGAGDRLDRLMAGSAGSSIPRRTGPRCRPSWSHRSPPHPAAVRRPSRWATCLSRPRPIRRHADAGAATGTGRHGDRARPPGRLHVPVDREDVRRGRHPDGADHPRPGQPSAAFQNELETASANGRPGRTATTAAGAGRRRPGARRLRAPRATRCAPTTSRGHALRDAAAALTRTGKPVVLLPWWGAHTWVMTGYRADADPTVFRDAHVERALHPRPVVSAGLVDLGSLRPAGQLRGPAEMKRNFIAAGRGPEGAYPGTATDLVPGGACPRRSNRREGPRSRTASETGQQRAPSRPGRSRSPAGCATMPVDGTSSRVGHHRDAQAGQRREAPAAGCGGWRRSPG